jgi:hypothetical protein
MPSGYIACRATNSARVIDFSTVFHRAHASGPSRRIRATQAA